VTFATIYHIRVISEHRLPSLRIHAPHAGHPTARKGNQCSGEAAVEAAGRAWRLPYCPIKLLEEQEGFDAVVFLLVLGGAGPELLGEAGRGPVGTVGDVLKLPLAILSTEDKSTSPSLLLCDRL